MEITHSNPEIVPQEHGISTVAGTKLERFLRGFQEGVFQEEVNAFVKMHAYEFAIACPDGSYPLNWQERHQEYTELFDQQLEAILWFQDSDKGQFLSLCSSMQQACEHLPDDALLPDIWPDDPQQVGSAPVSVAAFRSFLATLTASEDFERFLQVMFAAVSGTLRATVLLSACDGTPAPPEMATPYTHEIEVRVPEGCSGYTSGSLLPVDFLGERHELSMPEGYGPGMTFKASITISA